jgi:hypothetical protein
VFHRLRPPIFLLAREELNELGWLRSIVESLNTVISSVALAENHQDGKMKQIHPSTIHPSVAALAGNILFLCIIHSMHKN